LKKYRILIIEDELIPANYIKKILLKHGHNVIGIARSKIEMLTYLTKNIFPELALMDINIEGDSDGISAAHTLLEYSPSTALIYLTAYHDEETLIRADKTNPIGYLAKPIQIQSLLSTISIGMLNFHNKNSIEKIRFSDNTFYDVTTRSIIDNGVCIPLSNHEAKLLTLLTKEPGQFISYLELENYIWPDEARRGSALRTILWRLKKKLPSHVTIENLYNSGYRISF